MKDHKEHKLFLFQSLTRRRVILKLAFSNSSGTERGVFCLRDMVSIHLDAISYVLTQVYALTGVTENAPTALLIYSFPSPSERFLPKLQTVLLQSKPILHSQWNPVRPGSLALCCGTGGFYTWSNEWSSDDLSGSSGGNEEVAECIGIPAGK